MSNLERPRGGFASKIRFADPAVNKTNDEAPSPEQAQEAAAKRQQALEARLSALEQKLGSRGNRKGLASKVRFVGHRT